MAKDQKTVIREMLDHAVHFGHKTSRWNPKMSSYLYGKKNNVHIFDLNKSYQGLMNALNFLKEASNNGKTILFVSTKQQAVEPVREAAIKLKKPYVVNRWIPGLLTNFKTIKSRIQHLKTLKEDKESGELAKYTKKEQLDFDKEIEKLENSLGGVINLEKLPDVLLVFDAHQDRLAIEEAHKMGITVVAITDSNADPDQVDFLIPGNDDSLKSIHFFIKEFESVLS